MIAFAEHPTPANDLVVIKEKMHIGDQPTAHILPYAMVVHQILCLDQNLWFAKQNLGAGGSDQHAVIGG